MDAKLIVCLIFLGLLAISECKPKEGLLEPLLGGGEEEAGRGGGRGGGHKGSKKQREKKKDLLDDLSGATSAVLSPRAWMKQARKFCRRFPGHPKCSGGKTPSLFELGTLLESVKHDRGKFLPRVRKLKIRDPLEGVSADLAETTKNLRKHFGEIDEDSVKKMKGACKRRKCKEQDDSTKKKKEIVLNKVFEFENNLTGKDNSEAIQLRMDRTHQIKQALLEKANMTDEVTAADDGVFDKDLLLTEEQQVYILNRLDKGGVGTDEAPPPPLDDSDSESDTEGTPARSRRASIFFEENIIQKWDISRPIPYTFDDSLEELDKNDIRGALAEIQAKTCVKFVYTANPTSYHLNYIKVDSPTFCGLSYVGRASPANPIYLSFQCGNGRGVAVHETMHALGVAHQHLRMDRDQWITVDWSNINPQFYDTFAVSDSKMFTSYGVTYDYGSIMHYNAYTAAIDISKPTMIPKVNPGSNTQVLGQRDAMSANDVTILKKMYCQQGCNDNNVFCGAWALKGLCTAPANAGYLQANCKKSCNLCAAG